MSFELIDIEHIIKAVKEAGIQKFTRDKFTFYSNIGLLFTPDLKIKPELHKGMKIRYAKEIIDRIKKIYELKGYGYSLDEIRSMLVEKDGEYVSKLYEEADISLLPAPFAANAKAIIWVKDGYYRGILRIYGDIISKLEVSWKEALVENNVLNYTFKELTGQVCDKDNAVIETFFKEAITISNKKIQAKDKLRKGFVEKARVLNDFLNKNVPPKGELKELKE